MTSSRLLMWMIHVALQISSLLCQINNQCSNMQPICTDQGLIFTALNTPQIAPSGNSYGCLSTQPDPTWYYLKISNSSQVGGDLFMALSAAQDIDFVIYGPFPNLTLARAMCGSLGNGDVLLNGIKDCSYSSTNLETPHLAAVKSNEIYVMLITNYAEIVQDVSLLLTEPDSTAFTDCSIITPKPTQMPTYHPTVPTKYPTGSPSVSPSVAPSSLPSSAPSIAPSVSPTFAPSLAPSFTPTFAPSFSPTLAPSFNPSFSPTFAPSFSPTNAPSFAPSVPPSSAPSLFPSGAPLSVPSPTTIPTATIAPRPTAHPVSELTVNPSIKPSIFASTSHLTNTPTQTTVALATNGPTYNNNCSNADVETCEQITSWECDLNHYIALCPHTCGYCADNGAFCALTSTYGFTPHSGSALGGNEVFVHSPCFNDTKRQKLYCVFANNLVRGTAINSTTFMCIAPPQRSDVNVPFRVKFGDKYFQEEYTYRYSDYCSASAITSGFGVQYDNPFALSVSSNSTRTITWNPNDFASSSVIIYAGMWFHELEYYISGIVDIVDNNGSYHVTMPHINTSVFAAYQQAPQIKFWLKETHTKRRMLADSVTNAPTQNPTVTPCSASFPAVTLQGKSEYDKLDIYSDPQNMKSCVFSAKEVGLTTKLSNNFMVKEFTSDDAADGFRLSPKLIECVQSVRDDLNVPITINSGYRTVPWNKRKGGADSSFHLSGTAADIGRGSLDIRKLAKSVICNCKKLFESHGMAIGLGLAAGFVHVDLRPYGSVKYDDFSAWAREAGGHYSTSPFTTDEWRKFIKKYDNDIVCDPLAEFSSKLDPYVAFEAEKMRVETAQTVSKLGEKWVTFSQNALTAFHHCHWSCSITKRFGSSQAEAATSNYERYGQPCAVTKMNLANNGQGRNIAHENKDCTVGCYATLQTVPIVTSGCTLQPVTGFEITDLIRQSTAPTCIVSGDNAACGLPNDRDKPASAATTFGDPHYISFDGVQFDFQGIGVYELIVIEERNFVIQTLNERILRDLGVSVVTGIAVKQDAYPTIAVANDIHNANVLRIWFGNEPITLPPSNEPKNYEYFTLTYTPSKVTLNLHIGITISLTNNYGLSVSASCFLANTTTGLLGNFDADLNNDFTSKNGTTIPITSSNYDIYHSFGITWRVNKTSDILIPIQYYMDAVWNSSDYEPVTELDISSLDTSFVQEAERLCNGNAACVFDVLTTRRLSMGNATLQSLNEFDELKKLINKSDVLCTPLCQNGGECISDGICKCNGLYFGERCEFIINGPPMMQTTEYPSIDITTATDDDTDSEDDKGILDPLDGWIPGISANILLILIIIIFCIIFVGCLVLCCKQGSCIKSAEDHRKLYTEPDTPIDMDGQNWNGTESDAILTTDV